MGWLCEATRRDNVFRRILSVRFGLMLLIWSGLGYRMQWKKKEENQALIYESDVSTYMHSVCISQTIIIIYLIALHLLLKKNA